MHIRPAATSAVALAGLLLSACSLLPLDDDDTGGVDTGVFDTDVSTPNDLPDFLTDGTGPEVGPDGAIGLVPPDDIAQESSWCWTLTVERTQIALYVVGMDSGIVRRAGAYGDSHGSFDTDSIAYDGVDRLVMPGYNGNNHEWFEIDLTTGVVREGVDYSAGYAQAVSTWGDRFLALGDGPSPGALLYPDYDAMLAAAPTGETPPLDGHFSRHTVDGDRLYGAWHATDTIDVVDLNTGDLLEQIALDTYDDWVNGLGVRGGFVHVLDRDDQVWRFDLEGTLVDRVSLDGIGEHGLGVGGLWCDAP